MLCTPWAFSSLTRATASDSAVRSLVIRSIGTPSTPPSALAKSRAISTPAYSCLASGACGPVRGKTAPTLTLAASAGDGAVAHAAQARPSPMAASCRNRTRGILDRQAPGGFAWFEPSERLCLGHGLAILESGFARDQWPRGRGLWHRAGRSAGWVGFGRSLHESDREQGGLHAVSLDVLPRFAGGLGHQLCYAQPV